MPIDIAGFLETVPPVYIFTTLAIVAFTFINVLAFHDCKECKSKEGTATEAVKSTEEVPKTVRETTVETVETSNKALLSPKAPTPKQPEPVVEPVREQRTESRGRTEEPKETSTKRGSSRSKTPSRKSAVSRSTSRRSGSPSGGSGIEWEPYTPGSRKSVRARRPTESSFPVVKM